MRSSGNLGRGERRQQAEALERYVEEQRTQAVPPRGRPHTRAEKRRARQKRGSR